MEENQSAVDNGHGDSASFDTKEPLIDDMAIPDSDGSPQHSEQFNGDGNGDGNGDKNHENGTLGEPPLNVEDGAQEMDAIMDTAPVEDITFVDNSSSEAVVSADNAEIVPDSESADMDTCEDVNTVESLNDALDDSAKSGADNPSSYDAEAESIEDVETSKPERVVGEAYASSNKESSEAAQPFEFETPVEDTEASESMEPA